MVNYKHYIKNAQFIRKSINEELAYKRLEFEGHKEDIKNLVMLRELIRKGVVMAKENLENEKYIEDVLNNLGDEFDRKKENLIPKKYSLNEIYENNVTNYNLKNHKEYLEYFENLIKKLYNKK